MDEDTVNALKDGIRQYNDIIKKLSIRMVELEKDNRRLRSILEERTDCINQEIRDILAAYATPEQLARLPAEVRERSYHGVYKYRILSHGIT